MTWIFCKWELNISLNGMNILQIRAEYFLKKCSFMWYSRFYGYILPLFIRFCCTSRSSNAHLFKKKYHSFVSLVLIISKELFKEHKLETLLYTTRRQHIYLWFCLPSLKSAMDLVLGTRKDWQITENSRIGVVTLSASNF